VWVVTRAAELKPYTLRAWDEYVTILNADVAERSGGSRSFLWVDESPETRRRVLSGELAISSHDPRRVAQGLIHDWLGVMFVPNASLVQVLRVLNNYDRYSEICKPPIRNNSVIEQPGNTVKLNLVAVQKAFSETAAVEADEERPVPNRVCITANAVRIVENANYGQPNEHAFPEERRPGYIWRALIVQRLEQRDGACTSSWRRCP
jgi:hypothetical protein